MKVDCSVFSVSRCALSSIMGKGCGITPIFSPEQRKNLLQLFNLKTPLSFFFQSAGSSADRPAWPVLTGDALRSSSMNLAM